MLNYKKLVCGARRYNKLLP